MKIPPRLLWSPSDVEALEDSKSATLKYNPNHSPANGRFTSRGGGSGVNVAGSDEEFAFLKDAQYRRIEDPATGATIDQDEGLVLLMENRGYFDKPTTLEKGEFDRAEKLSLDMEYGYGNSSPTNIYPTTDFYRGIQNDNWGVTVEKMSESLVDGSSRFHGVGNFGNGLYFSPDKRRARGYAGDQGMLQRMALKPDTKVITTHALAAEAFKLHGELGSSYNNIREHGRLATWLGYDVIHADDRIVVLNHSKLIIDKSSLVRLPREKSLDLDVELKYNPNHDRQGRFATRAGGRDLLGNDPSTVSEEWAQGLLDQREYRWAEIDKMSADDERISRDGGDVSLSRIVDEQWGGTGTVKVTDLGNANDANLLFRGVEGSTDFHEGFINGDRFMGKGVYGNGIYFAQGGEFKVPGSALFQDNVGNAWYKAEGYGSNVRKYRISSSAKIVDWEALTAEHTAWLNKTEQGPVRSLTKDPGRYAALKGYDGIKSPPKKGVSQYVIFNRSVLEAHVDRQPDFSFNKSATFKYNPNHDQRGRFASGSFSERLSSANPDLVEALDGVVVGEAVFMSPDGKSFVRSKVRGLHMDIAEELGYLNNYHVGSVDAAVEAGLTRIFVTATDPLLSTNAAIYTKDKQRVRQAAFAINKALPEDKRGGARYHWETTTPYASGEGYITETLRVKGVKSLTFKYNPYHDQRGRFTTGIARGPYGDALAGSIDPHKKYPFDVRYPPASDDPAPGGRYEYHSTTASGLQRIAQEGLDPAKSQSGVTSVTPHLEGARFYGKIIENREQAWLLRVTRDNKIAKIKIPDGFDLDESREHWLTSKVEPKDISVYLDGHWEWVNSIKKKHLDLFETKYNPNHDRLGRFSHGGGGGGIDYLANGADSDLLSLLGDVDPNPPRDYRKEESNPFAEHVYSTLGYMGPIEEADHSKFADDALMWRGNNSTAFFDALAGRERDYAKMTYSPYGSGIYVGDKLTASGYGVNKATFALKPGAKVMTDKQVRDERMNLLADLARKDPAGRFSDDKNHQLLHAAASDPSIYAALRGAAVYEGERYKDGTYVRTILDRRAVTMEILGKRVKGVSVKFNPNHSPTTGRFVSAHTFRDGSPSDDIKALLAKTLDPLSDAEKNSLSAYTSTSYAGINRYAWMDPSKSEIFGGRPVDNLDIMYPSDYNLRHFTIMSGALEKTKTPVDLVVSHRMKAGERFFDSNGVPMDSSSVGKTLTNKGFTSTSLSKSVHLANTNWELEVPKGSKGAYVNPISSHKDEYEIILQRGAKFKITGFETDGLVTNIKARVVGFEPLESLDRRTKNFTLKYNPNHDSRGRFSSSRGRRVSTYTWEDGDIEVLETRDIIESSLDLRAVLSERARKHNPYHDERGRFASARGYFSGGPVNNPAPLTKAETGRIGEEIAMKYLGDTASTLNVGRNNYPIDLVSHDRVVEVKTGLSTNPKASQQWRATIGQPGKKESEWLKTATAEEKKAWNNQKRQAILERKQRAVDEVSQKLGRPLKPTTLGVIIDPHTREAHVYEFEGFHLRIGWSDKGVKEAYRASYKL